jgi:hypothetical protein
MSEAMKLFGTDGVVRLDVSRGHGNEWMRLNDLHSASGGDPSKQPAMWMRTDSARSLISERSADLQIESFRVVKGGNEPQGTWTHWELAVAYAEWLSPAFHLRVIREWRQFNEAKHASADPLELMRIQLDNLIAIRDRQRELEASHAVVTRKVAAIEAQTGHADDFFTVLEWSRLIGRPLPVSTARTLGRQAAAMSRGRGLAIGTATDERYGTVGTYHRSVLEELLGGPGEP